MPRWLRFGLVVWFALAVLGPLAAPHSFRAQDRSALLSPPRWDGSHVHWLGTDEFGRDVASRLLVASGLTSLLALAMAVPALGLALLAGLGAVFSPRLAAVARVAGEMGRSLPWIFVLVAVRAALPLDAGIMTAAAALVILFAMAAWPAAAWALFGAARDLMEQDFARAARGLGAGHWILLRRHLWPNVKGLAGTYFALLVAAAIGAEVSLELVGLGVPAPWPTWGNMLDPLRDYVVATRCWWLYTPLLVLIPVLLLLTLAAQRLSDEP